MVRAREHQIRLVTSVPDNLPAFRADRLKIKQILVNLLSSATKFTPEGGTVMSSGVSPNRTGAILSWRAKALVVLTLLRCVSAVSMQ